MAKLKIKSPDGSGIIDTEDSQMPAIQITENGYVQIRVHYPKKKIWIKYNMGKVQDILKEAFEINFQNPV